MEEDPSKVPEIPGEDHAEFRQQFIDRHPDVVLPHHREPHRKFVERLQRDFLVHGAVNFYEVGEMRTQNETIAQIQVSVAMQKTCSGWSRSTNLS